MRSLIGKQEVCLLLEVVELQLSLGFLSDRVDVADTICHHQGASGRRDLMVAILCLECFTHKTLRRICNLKLIQAVLGSVAYRHRLWNRPVSLIHGHRVGIVDV